MSSCFSQRNIILCVCCITYFYRKTAIQTFQIEIGDIFIICWPIHKGWKSTNVYWTCNSLAWCPLRFTWTVPLRNLTLRIHTSVCPSTFNPSVSLFNTLFTWTLSRPPKIPFTHMSYSTFPLLSNIKYWPPLFPILNSV